MPEVTLNFGQQGGSIATINTSVQVGDTAYYCDYGTDGGFTTNTSNIVEIGIIKSIGQEVNESGVLEWIIVVEAVSESLQLPVQAYILFTKDNSANMSSPLGYYSLIQFKNNSTVKSEIFSVGCEIFESSK
tara:strand:+ start:274 stop:666 length:393 start_codon:yes stop_codon:yes gene_type:complete